MSNEFNKVNDSGDRTKYSTGAVRDKRMGKGRYDLLPPRALHRLAKHFENGSVKYGDNNWLKGIPLRNYIDSAIRHIFEAKKHLEWGIPFTEDTLIAVVWNIMSLIETMELIDEGLLPKELDNMKVINNETKDKPIHSVKNTSGGLYEREDNNNYN